MSRDSEDFTAFMFNEEYNRSNGNNRHGGGFCGAASKYVGLMIAMTAVAVAIISIAATESESPLRNSTCVRVAQSFQKATVIGVLVVALVAAVAALAAAQNFIVVCRKLCQQNGGNPIVPTMAVATVLLVAVLVAAQHVCNNRNWELHSLSIVSICLAASAVIVYLCAA
jgi:amino acid transporter